MRGMEEKGDACRPVDGKLEAEDHLEDLCIDGRKY